MRLCLVLLFFGLTATAQDQFKPNGNPFHYFETATDFDSSCTSADGNAKPDSGGAAQNEVKNNLAAKGPVKEITIKDLAFLETETAKNKDYESWSGLHPPKTRKPFQKMNFDLKEGRLVQITAYIYEAHTADLSSGESVNCGIGTSKRAKHKVKKPEAEESNDIHIALVETKEETTEEDAECESVTAEVIPHFRPAVWDESLFKSTLQGKLVRLTGQLMYDSAHKPCSEDEEASPARQSSWEIHPIYKVEKCTEDDGKGNCTGEWKEVE
jgi:hypothetical protein